METAQEVILIIGTIVIGYNGIICFILLASMVSGRIASFFKVERNKGR